MPALTKEPTPPESRRVALELLQAVLEDRRPLDEALGAHRRLGRLAPRDRAFARMLTGTTLRRLGQLDALIDHCLDRPLKRGMADVRALLRLGASQLAILRTPAHAAVNTTVALANDAKATPYRGLINAVLRRLAHEREALMAEQDAERLSTPDWLWQSWVSAYGEAIARAIARVHLKEPPLDLTPRSEPELWAGRLDARLLPTGTLRLPPGAGEVAKLPGYLEGGWWVQDAAAALPARLLGPVSGTLVVDLCAAPGGKTAQLAAAGAEVVAVDQSDTRMLQLHQNLQRLGLAAATVVADASSWRPSAAANAVLLDAPCSGTGTLRRHPDIAHLKSRDDVIALTHLQDRLLRSAVEIVQPGGLIVYATCSLQPEEGPERIEALLDPARADGAVAVERVPIDPVEVNGLTELITEQGDLRTLPCHLAADGGLDGFYACRLRKLTG